MGVVFFRNYNLLLNPPTPRAKRASNTTAIGLPAAGRVFSPAAATLSTLAGSLESN